MSLSSSFQRPRAAFIPLTSLMDVLTILLVFLLVNYTATPQNISSGGVRLPQVSTVAAVPLDGDLADRIPVELHQDRIRVGEADIPFAGAMPRQIRESLDRELIRLSTQSRSRGKPARLLIRADASLPYRWVDWVLQAASRQSITDVKLVGSHREKS